MLTYLSSSIWASPAQTLVNTVNVVGRWGRCRSVLSLKKFGLQADIDQMVYELYGLTEKEIAIVEGSVA